MGPGQRYKFPWRVDNHFEVLVDSAEFIPRMLAAIGSARQYILLEMYLVESGALAERFIDALLEAAEREVRIYLLLDDFGALKLEPHDRERLAQHNIQTVYYNPLPSYSLVHNLYRIALRRITRGLHRNHRKLLLVDGKQAFTGSAGITDAVESPHAPDRRWRETMVAIRGPVLGDWQQLFMESWNRHVEQPLALPEMGPAGTDDGPPGRVTVNEHHRMGIQRSLLKQLKRARQRIWFATAYFIPSWNIRRKLKRAARTGVDVRLLLPGPVTDHPGARYASHRYYSRLLDSGVRIYEYTPRFFHAKTVLCDDWITIGSCNYDRWNLLWNLEANQEIEDQDMAATVAGIFMNDFDNSREIIASEWEQRSWHLRALEWFWKQVEHLSLKIKRRR